jgi:hypothetical protein
MNKILYWIGIVIIGMGTGTMSAILDIKLMYTIIIMVILDIIWMTLFYSISIYVYNKTHIENIPYITYITNGEAEKAYINGHVRLNTDKEGNWSYISRFIPNGFYAKELTFEEWLKHYNIKII